MGEPVTALVGELLAVVFLATGEPEARLGSWRLKGWGLRLRCEDELTFFTEGLTVVVVPGTKSMAEPFTEGLTAVVVPEDRSKGEK